MPLSASFKEQMCLILTRSTAWQEPTENKSKTEATKCRHEKWTYPARQLGSAEPKNIRLGPIATRCFSLPWYLSSVGHVTHGSKRVEGFAILEPSSGHSAAPPSRNHTEDRTLVTLVSRRKSQAKVLRLGKPCRCAQWGHSPAVSWGRGDSEGTFSTASEEPVFKGAVGAGQGRGGCG